MLIVITLMGCDGPYNDLEKDYPAKLNIEGKSIKSRTIVLTSRHHKGAYALRDVVSVRLSPEHIEMDVDLPRYKKVQIPIDSISGCGKSCFGSKIWDADILLGTKGIEISFKESSEIIEWCWETGLPMITGKDTRDWLYNGGVLPSREGYQQVDREGYARQTRRRCQGY